MTDLGSNPDTSIVKESTGGDFFGGFVRAFGSRMDGWANLVTRLGTSKDKRTSHNFGRSNRISWDRDTLEEMFHGDDIVARIVELPAKEMTREWIDLTVDIDGDETLDESSEVAGAVLQALDELNAQAAFSEVITWARLYGGAVIYMDIDDGQDPSEPLDEDRIVSLDNLIVMDRWDVDVFTRIEDPLDPDFGKPASYKIVRSGQDAGGSFGLEIHASRMLRFDGTMTGRKRRRENDGWGISIIERQFDTIRDFQQAYQGMAHLLTDFSHAVIRIKGLAKMLAADQDGLVLQRLDIINKSTSMVRAALLDEGEEYERKTTPVGGLSDLLDRSALRLSAATGMPVSILMGRSPSGLNATGESDIRLWYDNMAGDQASGLSPQMEKLIRIVMLTDDGPTGGVEPEDWTFRWLPLWQLSKLEEAQYRLMVAQADAIYVDRTVLRPIEVAVSRWGTGEYSAETNIDRDLDEQRDPSANGERQDSKRLPVLDAEEDAPNYRQQDDQNFPGQVCLSCSHARPGNVCSRWDFNFERGFTCDDWISSPAPGVSRGDGNPYRASRTQEDDVKRRKKRRRGRGRR